MKAQESRGGAGTQVWRPGSRCVEGKGKEVHVTRPGGSRGGAGLHRGTWEPVCPEDLKPNTLEEMVGGGPGWAGFVCGPRPDASTYPRLHGVRGG